MIGPLRPLALVTVAGVPLGVELFSGMTEFAYRDVHHGEVDDIRFTLADPLGSWRSAAGPQEGDLVTALIGYDGLLGGLIPCGTYELDEPEAEVGADGDLMSFSGLSAFTSRALRTARSEAYEDTTLAGIVGRVAKRHGMTVVGPVPEVRFTRITQSKTPDLEFLYRLADDWGCYFSPKGDQLVFIDRLAVDGQEAAHRIDVAPGDLLGTRLRRSAKGLYRRAELAYQDTGSKRTLRAAAEDPRVRSGDVLKLTDKVENQGQADRLVLARLLRENDGWSTGSVELAGRPSLVAGQVIELGPTLGRYAGRWLVTAAEHVAGGDGYRTTAEVRGL